MYNVLSDLKQTERIAVGAMFDDNQKWSYYNVNNIRVSIQSNDDFNPLTNDLVKTYEDVYNNIVVRIPKLGELIIFQDYFNDGIYGVEDLCEKFIIPSTTHRSSIGILYRTSNNVGELCFVTKYKSTIYVRQLLNHINYTVKDMMSTISNKKPTNFSFTCSESNPREMIKLIIKIYKYTDDEFTNPDVQEYSIDTNLDLNDVMKPSRLGRLGFLNNLITHDYDRLNRLPQLMLSEDTESYYLCPTYLMRNEWDYSSNTKTWSKGGIELELGYGLSYVLPNYDEVWTSDELDVILNNKDQINNE